MKRALEGLKILDLTMNLPGPYMTWLAAVLGAEVLKVESPQGGDYARNIGGFTQADSPAFEAVNRNKKSLALNLKSDQGRQVFHRLLAEYDVVAEGFRPGVMDRLGLGFDALSLRQSRLIMVSISGYGQSGPYRDRAGHDIDYLALAGISAMTGTADGEPALPGVQAADLFGGALLGLCALLAAVHQRSVTGSGQHIDAAMFDGVLSMATMVYGLVAAGLEKPLPGKMMLNGALPCYSYYPTADGRHMALGALEPKFWQAFCGALGREDLLGRQFDGSAKPDVAAIFAQRTRAEWTAWAAGVDCCLEPVLTLDEAVGSDLVQARDMVEEIRGRKYLASPLRLSASPPPETTPAPALGQHSEEALLSAGFTQAEVEGLVAAGVVLRGEG